MRKLMITVPVYGPVYSEIFLNYQLGSLLEDLTDRVEYGIYTDAETLPIIQAHPNYVALTKLIPVKIYLFSWPTNANRFAERYSVLVSTFKMSVRAALESGSYLSAIVADLVFAKGYLSKIFKRLDEGYDSVFVLPLRSAYEAIAPALQGALPEYELFMHGYLNMHPLFMACHWDTPQFSKLPFSLIWNNGRGLMVRSYSITPIAFTPSDGMLSASQVIDVEIPSMCKNPYWAHDWIEAPVIGVEPLVAYFPPYLNRPATTEWVKQWALKTLHRSQHSFLKERLYYPSRAMVGECHEDISDKIIECLSPN